MCSLTVYNRKVGAYTVYVATRGSMRTLLNAAGLVLVVAALVTFCVLNIGRVDLTLLVLNGFRIEYMAWPLPLCVLVLAPFGCGIVLGCSAGRGKNFTAQTRSACPEKRIRAAPQPTPGLVHAPQHHAFSP